MFGTGPMLPAIPAAERGNSSSKKVQARKSKHSPRAENHKLSILRRPSTIKTESTLFEDNDEYAVQEPTATAHHQRDLSLIVDFNLEHAVEQLKNGEISDLELVFFAFWIKAKLENYLMARELVRELALDQGYNIDKIANPRVRKLLQEVHDIRPRDPRHASTWESPFRNQTRTSSMRKRGSTRAVSSPLTARMDTLPPSLRAKRELAVQEAARSIMISGDVNDYPPNTPDRPAPLSVKSRNSQVSNSTSMPTSVLRSVSTPIHIPPKGDLNPLPQRESTSKTRDTEALALFSSITAEDLCPGTGDAFGAVHSTNQSHHKLFTDRLQSTEDRPYGTPAKYIYRDPSSHALGSYQLDASDIASESSYGTFTSLVRKNKKRVSTGIFLEGGIIGNESFDALQSYLGSEDEDQGSILESASNISEVDAPTQYQYAVQVPPCQSTIAGPVPRSSERCAVTESRRKARAPSLPSQAATFHRPLPLRSYESEATMFPTAGARANSDHNRSRSVTSIIASRRPATGAMAVPYRTDSTQTRNSLDDIGRDFYESNDSQTKISELVDREIASVTQCSSNASTLAAFPIPPMGNPVGELPILVSRAVSSPLSLHTTASQHPVVFASLEDTYRAIVKVAMVAVLQRTRVRGEGLRAVDWDKLTSFERAWREMNKLLLETVYGRRDVILEESDVAYIDRIAQELRNESNNVESTDWVRHLFETDA